MLHVVCCMLYVVRCMLYVVCCTLYVVRCMLYVVCCALYVVRCMLYGTTLGRWGTIMDYDEEKQYAAVNDFYSNVFTMVSFQIFK